MWYVEVFLSTHSAKPAVLKRDSDLNRGVPGLFLYSEFPKFVCSGQHFCQRDIPTVFICEMKGRHLGLIVVEVGAGQESVQLCLCTLLKGSKR